MISKKIIEESMSKVNVSRKVGPWGLVCFERLPEIEQQFPLKELACNFILGSRMYFPVSEPVSQQIISKQMVERLHDIMYYDIRQDLVRLIYQLRSSSFEQVEAALKDLLLKLDE
jgi:hypothetical protein